MRFFGYALRTLRGFFTSLCFIQNDKIKNWEFQFVKTLRLAWC